MVEVNIEHTGDHPGCHSPHTLFTDITGEVTSGDSEALQLAVINRLLAKQRAFACDHERGGEMFHGAAIIQTNAGKWFLAANVHVQNPETTRNCAEANAITEAYQREGKNLQIKALWFMGGKANYETGQIFIDNEGQRHTPCGSCLDVIHNHQLKADQKTLVHMLPLNDGTMKLSPGNPDDTRPAEQLEPDQVFTRRIGDLLPHVRAALDDSDHSRRDMMLRGYEWLTSKEAISAVAEAATQQQMLHLEILESGEATEEMRLNAVNRALMQAARDYYQDAKADGNGTFHTLSVAIIRATDGHYYIGKTIKNGHSSASSAAEIKALEQAINASSRNNITDIFVVNFSAEELQHLQEQPQAQGLDIKIPDGATRERLKKTSPSPPSMQKDFFGRACHQGCQVHVFLPNNPERDEFDPKRHMLRFSIQDLLPYGYRNPKAELRQRPRNDGTHHTSTPDDRPPSISM